MICERIVSKARGSWRMGRKSRNWVPYIIRKLRWRGLFFGVHGRKRNIVPSWESRDRDVVWNEGILCQPFGNELLFG